MKKEERKRLKKKGFPVAWRFLIIYLLFSLTVAVVFAFAYYRQFNRGVIEIVRSQAKDTAAAVSRQVDFTGHDEISDPEDVQGETYKRLYDELFYITGLNTMYTYIYTMRPQPGGQINTDWVFVVDACIGEDFDGDGRITPDEDTQPPGTYYDITEWQGVLVALEEPGADPTFYTDQWGTYISGYAPIYDQGNLTGIVAVDFGVAGIRQIQQVFLYALIITFLITLALALIFAGVGVALFIQENKKLRASLEERNGRLEELVDERTNVLKQFMVAIVEDLQTPLRGMKSQLLKVHEQVSGKSNKEELKVMMNVVESLQNLVRTILVASEFGLGRVPLVKQPGRFDELAKRIVKEFSPFAESESIKLVSSVKAVPEFEFDSNRMAQVLYNLLSNAVKFTQEGGTVRLSVAPDKSGRHVRVEVKDTGKGISKEDLAKLFIPFMRVGDQKEAGNGLGLSVVRGIVEAHDGEVGVESEVDKGSTFWFEMPI